MDHLFGHAITVFMAFFAVMNPIANTAVFASLTAGRDKSGQRAIACKSLCVTFLIILVFAALGKMIFQLFGITLPALQIAGGILIFIIGYDMLHGKNSKLHTAKDGRDVGSTDVKDELAVRSGANVGGLAEDDASIAISPLAVPLLAGPGTIATAMNYSALGGWMGVTITVAAFASLCIITFVCFVCSAKITTTIGKNGIDIVTRLMGLILAVIGVQMLIEGIKGAFAL